eukprot:4389642-Prymnesium_polylepis.1
MAFGSSIAGRKVEPGPTCYHTPEREAERVCRERLARALTCVGPEKVAHGQHPVQMTKNAPPQKPPSFRLSFDV